MDIRKHVVVLVWLLLIAAGYSQSATLSITELVDVDFGSIPRDLNPIQQRITFCVSMTPRGPFMLTAIGSGSGGSFAMTNISGGSWEIGYFLQIRGHELTAGVPQTGIHQAGPPGAGGECRPPRFPLIITVDTADVSTAPAGQYQGLLQLTVAPE